MLQPSQCSGVVVCEVVPVDVAVDEGVVVTEVVALEVCDVDGVDGYSKN